MIQDKTLKINPTLVTHLEWEDIVDKNCLSTDQTEETCTMFNLAVFCWDVYQENKYNNIQVMQKLFN